MKRYLLVAASTCALALALAAGPAFAGSLIPPGPTAPGGGDQNTAILTNDPVLSGNSVAGINTGNQTSSADPTATQTNGTTDDPAPAATPQAGGAQPASTGQPALNPPDGGDPSHGGDQNTAILSNDPVASGNSVAVINTGDQSSSADPTLTQANSGSNGPQGAPGGSKSGPDGCGCDGGQGPKEQGSKDDGDSNVAVLSNDPVASGNSVAVINGGGGGGCGCQEQGKDDGGQTSSADPTLTQTNDSHDSSQGDRNVAILDNDPVASGNSVALINTGSQTSSADPTLTQTNSAGPSKSDGKSKDTKGKSKDGDRNVAILSNDPVASGNSVALINTGDQTSSASPTLTQTNGRDEQGKNGQKPSSKPCPKPEPKPCPKPEPKPCPKPEPKPCPKPEPKPCKPPCPPAPCEGQPGGPIGIVTSSVGRLI